MEILTDLNMMNRMVSPQFDSAITSYLVPLGMLEICAIEKESTDDGSFSVVSFVAICKHKPSQILQTHKNHFFIFTMHTKM